MIHNMEIIIAPQAVTECMKRSLEKFWMEQYNYNTSFISGMDIYEAVFIVESVDRNVRVME